MFWGLLDGRRQVRWRRLRRPESWAVTHLLQGTRYGSSTPPSWLVKQLARSRIRAERKTGAQPKCALAQPNRLRGRKLLAGWLVVSRGSWGECDGGLAAGAGRGALLDLLVKMGFCSSRSGSVLLIIAVAAAQPGHITAQTCTR